MKNTGTLYLIPTLLGDTSVEKVIPEYVLQRMLELDIFIVENIRTARRYLVKSGYTKSIDDIQFFVLNKHTKSTEIPSFLNPCIEGKNIGLLSESGTPCIADPGAVVVKYAHEIGLKTEPLTGPSSIILSLMASGFNGQNFAFNGYLPIQTHDAKSKIKELENKVIKDNQTQIFIETPYRNEKLLENIITICQKNTRLCVACEISTQEEQIITLKIADWKKYKIDIHKKNTIFLLGR